MKKWRSLSLPEEYENNTTSPPKPLEIGLEQEKSLLELLNMIRERPGYMTCTEWEKSATIKMALPHPHSPEFCMLVFLARNKKMTSKDKLSYFKMHSQTQKFFLTLDLELITKEEDFASWWNESVKEKSERLWLPTKTGSSDSGLISSNKSAMSMEQESWFGAKQISTLKTQIKNSKRTSSVSSTFLSQKEMVPEGENYDEREKPTKKWTLKALKERAKADGHKGYSRMKKDELLKLLKVPDKPQKDSPNSLIKIRIYPNTSQKYKLDQLFDANRWAWNTLVDKTKGRIFDDKVDIVKLQREVRPLIQKKTMQSPDRITSSPEEVLDSAFRDFWKARKTVLALSKAQKDKTGTGFQCKYINFRRKKSDSQSIEIRSRSVGVRENGFVIWSKFFGSKESLMVKEELPELNYSLRLQKTRTGDYYLCIPRHRDYYKVNGEKTCAIDPGVRTMLTGYDPEGFIFELGTNIDQIVKRWLISDKLQGELRHFKGKRNKRFNLKRYQLNNLGKIKRMMKDCHHKITKWISTNYKQVLLPKFETGEMVKRFRRVIGRETARKMMGWSHWMFKEMLRSKMDVRGGALIDCTEEYTSKTCTNCGRLNHILGSSKTFNCPFEDCKLKIDRDIGAARNIYLKNSPLLC